MKISSLGYNPAIQTTQNSKKKQQNPAFKGAIIGITEDAKKGLDLYNLFDELSVIVAKLTAGTEHAIGFLREQFGNKTVMSITFDSSFDEKAEAFVNRSNKKFAVKTSDFRFEFKKCD